MPDHHMIRLCCQSLLQEHLEAASSCFANTENLRFLITIIIVFSAHKYFIDFFKKMWHVTYQNNP